MSVQTIVHAYRHLYRHSLRAVQFSKPARYVIRDHLRYAFRKGRQEDFDPRKIANTLEFLHYATIENGLEHKILKNMATIWQHQAKGGLRRLKALTCDLFLQTSSGLH
jgi:hypothetical protein